MGRCRCASLYRRLVALRVGQPVRGSVRHVLCSTVPVWPRVMGWLVLPRATVVVRGYRAEGLAMLGVSSTDAPPSRGGAGDSDVTRHLGGPSGGPLFIAVRARRMRASPASPMAHCAWAAASLIRDEANGSSGGNP
jgi:hypothetical protein